MEDVHTSIFNKIEQKGYGVSTNTAHRRLTKNYTVETFKILK